MTHQLSIKIALQSTTSLAVGKGSGEGTIIDNGIMRDSRNLPYIPGSQLKGTLRYRTTQLCNSLKLPSHIVTDMFGSAYGTDAKPGALRFANLSAQVNPESSAFISQARTSVKISRSRRVAEEKLLRTIEVANDRLVYSNDKAISGKIADTRYAALIYAALLVNSTWGHSKSRGLGWMEPNQIAVSVDGKLLTHEELIGLIASLGNEHHG